MEGAMGKIARVTLRIGLSLILGSALASAQPAPRLSPRARALLRPVLSEFLAMHAEEFDSAGRYIRESPHQRIFERRFEKLMATSGPAADEAIAGLMAFYVGEYPAETLVCEAIKRGKHIRPYLVRFRDRAPVTGLEPIPSFYTAIPNLRAEALKAIDSGEKPCEYE
jgi:hypothetical protein